MQWRLVGSLPARPAVRWLLVTWFRFRGHRRLIEIDALPEHEIIPVTDARGEA